MGVVFNAPGEPGPVEREAKALAALNHPHIAAIYGFDADRGTHFLVPELVEGDTLGQRLTQGRLPIEEALRLARQITAISSRGTSRSHRMAGSRCWILVWPRWSKASAAARERPIGTPIPRMQRRCRPKRPCPERSWGPRLI